MSAGARAHDAHDAHDAHARHLDSLLGPGGTHASAAKALLVAGNLPVAGRAWIPHFIDRLASAQGPMALLGLSDGEVRVQVLRGSERIERIAGPSRGGLAFPEDESACAALLTQLAGEVVAWVISPESTRVLEIPRDISRITVLSGADAAALAACARIVGDACDAVRRAPSGGAVPQVGVAILGADPATAASAVESIARSVSDQAGAVRGAAAGMDGMGVGIDIVREQPMQRIGAAEVALDRDFTISDATVEGVLALVAEAEAARSRADGARGPWMGRQGAAIADATMGQRSRAADRAGAGANMAATARPDARFAPLAGRVGPRHAIRSGGEHANHGGSIPFPGIPPAPVARATGIPLAPQDARAVIETASRDREEFRAGRAGVPPVRPRNEAMPRGQAAAAHAGATTSREASAGAGAARGGIAPQPAALHAARVLAGAWPDALVRWMRGLEAYPHRAPRAPGVEIAFDADGVLHVVGRAEDLRTLLEVKAWIREHASILSAAHAASDPTREPIIDAVVRGIAGAPRLDGVRMHAWVEVEVGGLRGIAVEPIEA